MKTRHVLIAPLLFGAIAALPAAAERDPFWPIGYEPPKPVTVSTESAVKAPEPPKPQKTVVKPITEADWAAARKALVVSGFTETTRPDTKETSVLAMVNRRMVAAGDTVTFEHQDVRFIWRVEAIVDRTLQLLPVKAERVFPKPANLNQ